ncbi:MAG: hypothetical protein HY462_00220 [Parcubacteria group bacterium]|nr:hypothetical protein [Parcubacteria group bacterium]
MQPSPFHKTFIASQRLKLEEERKRLEGELLRRGKRVRAGSADFTPAYQDYGTDEDSNAAEYAQHETDLSVEEELEEELARVNAALERIKQGTYGLDVATQEPIGKKRLEAYPAAETAI